ncbi:hypothetical protein EDB85DRAFT_1860463 [Lactarius pseudohatsudake]|nr:hypothetical protein EDB85DRAFT_1860463 [Lactarius pseudohatsudake]
MRRWQCPFPQCPLKFKTQRGRKCHIRTVHTNSNRRPVIRNLERAARTDSEGGDDGHSANLENRRGPAAQRIEHPYLTALPCDSEGNFLPPGAPPPPRETPAQGDWTPFDSEAQFMLADLLFRRAEMSASNIDTLVDIWAQSTAEVNQPPPFESHEHMYATIDASTLGDVPWKCFIAGFSGNVDNSSPEWMRTSYDVWYRDPDVVVSNMLSNPDFAGQFDLRPYIDLDSGGKRRWSNVMSGNIAWRHSDDIFTSDNSTEGCMYCPIILGSDKTTVSVATGHVEYHPLYLSIGNPHNTIRRAHRNAVIPIAFLAIPTCDRNSDDNRGFRVFKYQLYHASLAAILRTLRPGMETPVVRRCPDGHFRRVIYDFVAFIADYPEQAMLTGIVSDWCPRCTAPLNVVFETRVCPRTAALTNGLTRLVDLKTLWTDYGINGDIVPFTSDFPRADIYEMMSPDLLHQVIKGAFKDHLVQWICEYIIKVHGETRGKAILDDIDRRIAAVPLFPGLRRFPHGRRFKQWTGDDSKALMKVYLPTIVGYVPENMVRCMTALLDACYIVRRHDIDIDALNDFDAALRKYFDLREMFRTLGVRRKGFRHPKQHSLVHYRRQVEDFGAPGGLCSSITESRHITAVKKPWRRSNRYKALGQMLLTNQRLDKLAAMHIDFAERDMLPAGRAPPRYTSRVPNQSRPNGDDSEGEDEGPVEDEVVEGHVDLAQTRARQYPRDIDDLSLHINEPNLHFLTQVALAHQLNTDVDHVPPIDNTISVFHSAVATFHAPSDPSGTQGMRRERIRSTPSWRGQMPRRDCAFIVEDDDKPGMRGMCVVRVLLFFSFEYDDTYYPFALVEWFKKVGLDPITGMWVVRPDMVRGRRERSVVHLDSFLRAAHLIPAFGVHEIPKDFHFTFSLDAFDAYYVNKYIDNHANEIAF